MFTYKGHRIEICRVEASRGGYSWTYRIGDSAETGPYSPTSRIAEDEAKRAVDARHAN